MDMNSLATAFQKIPFHTHLVAVLGNAATLSALPAQTKVAIAAGSFTVAFYAYQLGKQFIDDWGIASMQNRLRLRRLLMGSLTAMLVFVVAALFV